MNRKFVIFTVILLAAALLASCKEHPSAKAEADASITVDQYDRAAGIDDFSHIKTSVSCQLFGQSFSYSYEITQTGDHAYTAKDLSTGAEYFSSDFDSTEAFLLRFCYLPPAKSDRFASFQIEEQTLRAELPSETMREELLRAGPLLSGYLGQGIDQVSLGTCAYTASLRPELTLSSYVYTVPITVNDAMVHFGADLTLTIENLDN